jgi:glycosyltransferase involved in cell wall biosynthesis
LIAKLYWKKLDNIFAVSEFGKSEIELFYGIPKNHISIIYPGSDHLWNITSEALRIDHSKCNIVIIGRWQKYKNVHSVLEALLNLEVSLLKYFHIFIIGRQNSSYKHHIQKLINQFQFNNLSLYDYLSDGELKYLYQNADLIINPSINEGFGIPAFEAFAEGAPIAVHQGLPADVLLSNKPQVYIVDMLNIESLIALLRNHKTFRHVSVNERRSYLIDNSLTWNQMCKNYVSRYLDV